MEVGHAFQGDYAIMENGERAVSELDLERDAWARAERLLDGLSL